MTLPDSPETAASENGSTAPRKSPSRYEPTLVPRLVAAQKALTDRFNDLIATIERDPANNSSSVEECLRQFTAVRHIETIWLYPIVAQATESDADARSEFAELRLVGLILARRVLRSFDELTQAIRAEVLAADAALRLARALVKYASHSERAVYPLYELVGSVRNEAAAAA